MSSRDAPCRSMDVANECLSKWAAPGRGRTTPVRRNALSTISETAQEPKAQNGGRQRINSVSPLVRGRSFFR